MPDEPLRLFLRDASEIAERLHCDLATRGYEVWQDVKSLRAGRRWDEDVPEGLRTSQVMLALLSPSRCAELAKRAIPPPPTVSAWMNRLCAGSCKIRFVPVASGALRGSVLNLAVSPRRIALNAARSSTEPKLRFDHPELAQPENE
jgi:hypothetical protein